MTTSGGRRCGRRGCSHDDGAGKLFAAAFAEVQALCNYGDAVSGFDRQQMGSAIERVVLAQPDPMMTHR